MDAYLQFLSAKASSVENIPRRIRGRVMHLMSDICPGVLHAIRHDGADMWMHAGQDDHSCTASAAALAFWLSPPASPVPARTLAELAEEHHAVSFAELASDMAVASLVRPLFSPDCSGTRATLLVFSTAPHKFAVLCVGGADQQPCAVLLQSNQDDTRGGRRFTLSEWLRGGGGRLTPVQLSEMIRQLASAAAGAADHEAVFGGYFGGARFKRGNISEYWVAPLPVTRDVAA